VEDGAHFAVFEGFFVVGVAEEGEEGSFDAEGGFDDVGDEFLAGFGVGIGEGDAGVGGVAGEVEVSAVGEAVELASAEGEVVDEIDGALGIVGELFFRMLFFVNVGRVESNFFTPGVHGREPLFKGFFPRRFPDEVFDLHLFEFDDAEDEVPGSDFVAKGFADLGHSEGDFDAHGVDDVLEVEEDRLGSFRAQISEIAAGAGFAHVGLEHEIEDARFGEIALTTFGTGDFVGFDLFGHLGKGHPVGVFVESVLDQVVAAKARFARLAVDQGVVEALDVTRGFPRFWVEQNGAIEPHHVAPLLDKHLPPEVFDVLLELSSVGAVRIGVRKPAVNFRARVNEASSFTKGNNRFQGILHNKTFYQSPPAKVHRPVKPALLAPV